MTPKEIKERREAKDMTREDLAVAMNCSVVSVRFWEKGISTPNEVNQLKLKEVLK